MKVADYKIYQFYKLGNFGSEMAKVFIYFSISEPYQKPLRPREDPRASAFFVDVIDCMTGSVRLAVPVNRLHSMLEKPKLDPKIQVLIDAELANSKGVLENA